MAHVTHVMKTYDCRAGYSVDKGVLIFQCNSVKIRGELLLNSLFWSRKV